MEGWDGEISALLTTGALSQKTVCVCEGPRFFLSTLSIGYQPTSGSTYPGVSRCEKPHFAAYLDPPAVDNGGLGEHPGRDVKAMASKEVP